MKNATRRHEGSLAVVLRAQGCEVLRARSGSLVAQRVAPDGRTYRLTVELYEDAAAAPARRFRVRVARRFGLPVCARHGATPGEALARVEWPLLDSFRLPMPAPRIAGLF
ncbi:MAG: hypothetical protein H6828_09895 [Planctomycetes bacterium]|nr:hypothetical protein [Planctomycetota bacterium]